MAIVAAFRRDQSAKDSAENGTVTAFSLMSACAVMQDTLANISLYTACGDLHAMILTLNVHQLVTFNSSRFGASKATLRRQLGFG